MKKSLLSLLAMVAIVVIATACGSDKKDEPQPEPQSQTISSVYASDADVHYTFDIKLDEDSSSIYFYNVVFTIGETKSPAMNIRIDAPVTVDNAGTTYTYRGTNIIPWMLRGTTWTPAPSFVVTNLTCTVNTSAATYSIFFNCHGGEYSDSGKLNL